MTHFTIRSMFLLLLFICIYFFVQAFSFLLFPICIAIIITLFLRPIVLTLHRRTKLAKWMLILLVLLTFFLSMITILAVIVFYLSQELEAILQPEKWSLTVLHDYIYAIFMKWNETASFLPIDKFVAYSFPLFVQQLEENSIAMLKGIFDVLSTILQSFTYIITFFFIVLFIVFFLLKDEAIFIDFFKKIIPSTLFSYVKEIQYTLHQSVFRFVKAQLMLVFITSAIIFCFLLIFQFSHIILITIVAFIIDFIPYIGIGLLFIPMIIYYFLTEQYVETIQLSSLYMFLLILRQILEPKWYAASIGLHPLVVFLVLLCMIHLFGIIGIILAPIVIIFISVCYYTRIFQLCWHYVKTGNFNLS